MIFGFGGGSSKRVHPSKSPVQKFDHKTIFPVPYMGERKQKHTGKYFLISVIYNKNHTSYDSTYYHLIIYV